MLLLWDYFIGTPFDFGFRLTDMLDQTTSKNRKTLRASKIICISNKNIIVHEMFKQMVNRLTSRDREEEREATQQISILIFYLKIQIKFDSLNWNCGHNLKWRRFQAKESKKYIKSCDCPNRRIHIFLNSFDRHHQGCDTIKRFHIEEERKRKKNLKWWCRRRQQISLFVNRSNKIF